MDYTNFSIEEFLGIFVFTGILMFIVIIFFDGLGKIKDFFYVSTRRRSRRRVRKKL